MATLQHGLLARAQDIFLDAQSKATNGTYSTAGTGRKMRTSDPQSSNATQQPPTHQPNTSDAAASRHMNLVTSCCIS